GTTERGLAYNAASNEVLLVSRNVSLSVNVLDGDTGAHLRTLNVSGISGGSFSLDRIGATDEGVIYAGNVTVPSSGNAPIFKLYRWANSDSNTPPVNIYSGAAGFANGTRVGDTFALRGAGTNTQILVGGRGTNAVALFTTVNGTNFT